MRTIRTMRTTTNISFYCRHSKVDSDGYAPVEICIIINGKRTMLSLPRKEKPNVFKNDCKKKSSEVYAFISEARKNIDRAMTDLLRYGQPITTYTIKEYVRNGGIRTYTITDLFDTFLKENKTSLVTYQKYRIIQRQFCSMFGGEKEANSISSNDINLFYSYLRSTEKETTAGAKMGKLKTIFKYAYEGGKIPTFPFSNIHISKGEPNKVYLTENEIKAIADKAIDIPRIAQVRDIFLFQASTGLSFSDMADTETILERNGVEYVQGRRKKTNVEYTAIVLPKGIEIWNRYNGKLPLLSNQKYNAYLKELADICGIQKTITTHTARKSYASVLYQKGVSIGVIAKMLGHTSEKTTQRTYAFLTEDNVLNEAAKILR